MPFRLTAGEIDHYDRKGGTNINLSFGIVLDNIIDYVITIRIDNILYNIIDYIVDYIIEYYPDDINTDTRRGSRCACQKIQLLEISHCVERNNHMYK